MELLLIRHAEPIRVDEGDTDGPADPVLSPRGEDQAARLGTWLTAEPIDAIITSPLRRARETAAPLASMLGLQPEVHHDLAEYDATSGSYIPVEHLRAEKDERWYAMIEGRWEETGGINPREFQARVVPVFETIIERFPGQRVAIIAHGGVVNVFLAHLLGIDKLLWFHCGYTSISRVQAARTGERSIESLNETAHLVATRDEAPR
jgi:probable phosphoglycerate mutase